VSASYPSSPARPTLASLLGSFAVEPGLPFADVLPEQLILDLCRDEAVAFATEPEDVFTPAITLWAWLTQCLSAAKSCVAAVARVLVHRVATNQPACSANTGGYCKARAKLPERFLRRLALEVGLRLEDAAPDGWRYKGRRVLLADGAECSLPDTPANQQEYPQPGSQKKGLGFPMIRLVVLLTFATAGVVGCALGPQQGKETGETALFRALIGSLRCGDLVVADRYYCSWWLVALLRAVGVDVCFWLHQRRRYDFRRGRRLGRADHVVSWPKPARPAWMDEVSYAGLPDSLEVREVRAVVDNPGFRSREIIIATSLLDADADPRSDIAELYHQRWHAELDIRAIKQTLGMDILGCKTPEMVRKEIWTHLLAYNLLRTAMAVAASENGIEPREVSFKGAKQALTAFAPKIEAARPEDRAPLVDAMLTVMAYHRVGDRPERWEPRARKRRPKPGARLTQPRVIAKLEQNRPKWY